MWASDSDVKVSLGRIGSRLPDEIVVADHAAMAAAEVRTALAGRYSDDALDGADGTAREALRWAQAKLAAASILSILRASLGDASLTVPERLRADAYAILGAPLPGLDPDVVAGDPGGRGGAVASLPRVTSGVPASNFADPYADARDDPALPLL